MYSRTVLLTLISIGFSIPIPHLESRIVNGIPISANKYPWMVALRYKEIYNETHYNEMCFCGGSLIHLSPPIVITAAHCLSDFGYDNITHTLIDLVDNSTAPPTLYVYVDINRTYPNHIVTSDSFTTLSVDYSMIEIHPLYNASADENDIALIIFKNHNPLKEPLPDIHPCDVPIIPHPLTLNESCCGANQTFITMGYGINASDSDYSPYTLEETLLYYVNELDCAREAMIIDYNTTNETFISSLLQHHFEPDHTIICAVGDDTDTCNGDSGGPLFYYVSYDNYSYGANYTWYWGNYSNYTWYHYANYSNYTECGGYVAQIVGITAFGYGDCADGSPAGYTSTAHFYDWIYDTVDSHLGGGDSSSEEGDIPLSSEGAFEDNQGTERRARGKTAIVIVTVICSIILLVLIIFCIYYWGIKKRIWNKSMRDLEKIDNEIQIDDVSVDKEDDEGEDQTETETGATALAQPMINTTN